MPAASTATPAAPRTFWSESVIAAAVDAVFAEALAQELAAVLEDDAPARPAIVLPDTDLLIAQAGIATGPCPPDLRTPSRSGHVLRAAGTFAARAAWWLLKHATFFAASALGHGLRLVWDITVNPQPSRPAPRPETLRALKAADFLEATSEHIRERGWTQHALVSARGVCMIGAERELIRAGAASRKTAAAANVHVHAVIGGVGIPWWNDRLRRTEEQVHQALLTAAERARDAAR
ncbi:DUF6197 family protein [Streptomyces mirabilis]|uniref:DUF6197 family protein n=1 Tax=Streptomyces mirabilis TaxID=68239 RepID=UPI00367E768C